MASDVKATEFRGGDAVRVRFEDGTLREGKVLTSGAYGMEQMAWVSLGGQREVCVSIDMLEVVA